MGAAETRGLENPHQNSRSRFDFVGTVLADTGRYLESVFQQQLNQQYVPPKLVLFNGIVNSTSCGTAQAAMVPFYCPIDQKVYIDTALV